MNVPKVQLSQISCRNLFSDLLHRPFICAHSPLLPFSSSIPSRNAIPRIATLSAEEFSTTFVNQPFILTDPVRQWPAYHQWSTNTLLKQYSKIKFKAEAVEWPFQTYVDYLDFNEDESPLYLFDCDFVEKMELKVGKENGGHYWPPECFGEDFFEVLGHHRPDHRWLIVGPKGSGSTFHKDPNATR